MAAMAKPEQIEVRSQDAITGEGSSCSAAETKPDSHCGEIVGSQVQLPEEFVGPAPHLISSERHQVWSSFCKDILHRIHALMPMRDAARAACVSHAFLRSWRCYPNLIISVDSVCINEYGSRYDKLTRDFITRVEHIMQNHSGMGVKEFRLQSYPCSTIDPSYLDHWIQVAMAPGIKEFELSLFEIGDIKYIFPCSLLSSERGSSIQSLMLSGCSIHSMAQVGCMSSLTNLGLYSVDISSEELLHFLSNSCALEKISLQDCNNIICLKIPCQLQKLNILSVLDCEMLEMIDSNAPNLSTFCCTGRQIHISHEHAFQVKEIRFDCSYALYYAITELPFIAPNLQTLFLSTNDETINTPMTLGKFVQLKYLEITLSTPNFSPDFDLSSLVSFLDASPTLDTFIIRIWMPTIRHDSILEDPDGDSSLLQCPSECYHDNLKNVMITGFCSAKSMVKLTIHIMQKAKSLDCLTLDTTRGHDKRFPNIDRCWPLNEEALVEAARARVAIERYIEERVPPSVNLKIIAPCSKCTYR